MHRSIILFLFSFAVGFWSCGNHDEYVPTENDRRVLRAYASLALLYDTFPATASRDSVMLYQQRADSILTQIGFTRDEFQREFEKLIDTPERFQPLFQELSAEIRKKMQQR